jgi:RNA polymerase sigma factor (sigma-70 family)
MPEPTDGELIAASQTMPARFGEIFERHQAAVYRYLDRRIGAHHADDLVAETFVQAFQRRASYDSARLEALPWLLGIATNLLRRHWRDERRQLRAYARTGRDPVAEPMEEAVERADAQRVAPALAAALASLSKGQRDVLLLHVYADLTDAEIADALALSPGTVRSRLSRARAHVREQISDIGQ